MYCSSIVCMLMLLAFDSNTRSIKWVRKPLISKKTGYVMTSDYDFRYKTNETGGIALQTTNPWIAYSNTDNQKVNSIPHGKEGDNRKE